jgi:hypothetical protein
MRLDVATLLVLLLPASIALAQEAGPEAVPKPEAEPEAEAEAEAVPEPKPEPKPEPVPEAEPEPEPVPEAEPEPEAEAEPEPEAEAEPEPEPEPETEETTTLGIPLEKPSPHQGHYIALGLHGTLGYVNDRDRGGRGPALGQGFSLRLGEAVTGWLDLGIALAYGSVRGDDPWSFGRLGVHAQVYPIEHYFVHGGFGFGVAGGDDPEDPGFSRFRFGDVYTAGAGRNIYLTDSKTSGGWIVSPTITAEYGRDDQFPNSVLWVGVEISHWWGIPRNQLDLDFDKAYYKRKK